MKFQRDVIDGHIHLYNWFDKKGNDFFSIIDNYQKNTGLKALSVLPITVQPYGNVEQNILAAIYKLHNKTAYAEAGIVYPSFPAKAPFPEGMDSYSQYKELMDIGFDGIKILFKPDSQKLLQMPMNDRYYDDFFAEAEKDGTHFIWHVADPEMFWDANVKSLWNYADGTYMSYSEMFEQVFDILDRYPKLNVSFAHFMFLSEDTKKLEKIFEKYENVGIDMTPGTEMYVNFSKNLGFYRDFIEKYADRITFGSDSEIPDNTESGELVRNVYKAITTDENVNIWGADVKGLNISEEASRKILYSNFRKKCADRPKEISKSALLKYIEKYKKFILGDDNMKMILEYSKNL